MPFPQVSHILHQLRHYGHKLQSIQRNHHLILSCEPEQNFLEIEIDFSKKKSK